jgi:hypothetical protein
MSAGGCAGPDGRGVRNGTGGRGGRSSCRVACHRGLPGEEGRPCPEDDGGQPRLGGEGRAQRLLW